MASIIGIAIVCLSVRLVSSDQTGEELFEKIPHDPFHPAKGIERSARTTEEEATREEHLSSRNNWGFSGDLVEWPEEKTATFSRKVEETPTTTPYYEEIDPNRNGLLKDIGTISEFPANIYSIDIYQIELSESIHSRGL
ncbi:hypothetical protein OESDEN_11189 [Oesophagostomum dentatum]|uniref:Uncharacterized protein n=1 Tax=Oesophagostomum dentatum TaxID=61180 RepID=A0A0B1SZR1_OESDE|nr:hypothetical protein OESDEN_11189 [Oesophagostomum dentatum]